MAHNTSRARRAAYVRAKPLSDYPGFSFICRCDPCRRNVTLRIDALLAELPPIQARSTVGDAMARLRCQDCRQAPTSVMVTNGVQMAVVIAGPGST